MNRLVLGTVQFGLPYGVANQDGKVPLSAAKDILDCAWSSGINTLDTAIAYGDSENCLGQIGVSDWQVISKLPELPIGTNGIQNWVIESVNASLQRLQIPSLYGLLLHRPEQLLGIEGQAIYNSLDFLKAEGLVEKIGISIYSPTELEKLFNRYAFDLVQAPYNICDRSLERSGWLARLKNAGVEVHARSIFLQGLLLMPLATRPAYFDRWHHLWIEWEEWLLETGLNPLQVCLSFALSNPDLDRILAGVDSLAQLQEILANANTQAAQLPDRLCCEDPDLINPARWQLT
jgi:aryl-alcohol dehydrogenase-like predicted oxidoreductase